MAVTQRLMPSCQSYAKYTRRYNRSLALSMMKYGIVDIAAHVDDVTPFIAYSHLLLMACGLNAIAQAYDYATPLVVLLMCARTVSKKYGRSINRTRSWLSWLQFIAKASVWIVRTYCTLSPRTISQLTMSRLL